MTGSDKSVVSVTSKAMGSQTLDGVLGRGRVLRVTVLSSSIGSQHRYREEGNRSSSSKSNSNSNSCTSATTTLVANNNEVGPACQVVDPIERPLGAQSHVQAARYRPVPSLLATAETTHYRLPMGGVATDGPLDRP
jgi:hypothetical protein